MKKVLKEDCEYFRKWFIFKCPDLVLPLSVLSLHKLLSLLEHTRAGEAWESVNMNVNLSNTQVFLRLDCYSRKHHKQDVE